MKKGATLVGALVAISILLITFIPLLNLQVGIIKAKYNKQYDNTANLMVSEGLEVVRAIYQSNLNETATGAEWNTGLAPGKYVGIYLTNIREGLTENDISTCNAENIASPTLDDSCALEKIGTTTLIYGYITINPTNSDRIKVKSTVIVKNLNLSTTKIYSADMELFNINKK
jgi:hypothetical protein